MTKRKKSPVIKQCLVAHRAVTNASNALHRLKWLCNQSCKPMTGRAKDIQSLVETIELMMIDLYQDIEANTEQDWI